MLSPSSLNKSLAHTLDSETRVCILLTPQSRLIAYASNPSNAEDLMKVLLGLSAEAWKDAQNRAKETVSVSASGTAMTGSNGSLGGEDELVRLESELGRVLIIPIYPSRPSLSLPQTLSPSSSYASDSLNSTTPKPLAIVPAPTSHSQTTTTMTAKSSEHGSNGSSNTSSGEVRFLLALNASDKVPWGLMRAKARHLRGMLGASLAEVSERLEGQANSPPKRHALLR